MSDSTNSKQREQLNTLFGHEKTHNLDASKELIKRIHIENTPFTIIGDEKKSYFIAFGMHRITELFNVNTFIEENTFIDENTAILATAKKILQEQQWHIICTLALIMYQGAKDLEKLKEQ